MSRVRGPNSALTEFLRERGIDALAIRRRYEETQNGTLEEETESSTVELSVQQNVRREIEEQIRSRRKSKKKRSQDSDDEAEFLARITSTRPNPGQIDFCAECGTRFTVTTYTKSARDSNGLLCHSCGSKYAEEEKQKKKTLAVSRKRKKSVAAALLDRQDFVVPKLQDLCIRVIAKYIDEVEMLGDIGDLNFDRIARILSKNRSLKDNTIKLFLSPEVRSLRFWDCSNLSADSFKMIAAFCPNIESLNLTMCGQLTDDVLDYYADKLPKLHELTLNGAFLVTSDCWGRFFFSRGIQLRKLSVSNTLRFNGKSMEALVETTGNSLEELSINQLGSLTESDLKHLWKLTRLTSLELNNLPDAVTDEALIPIIKGVGRQLITLSLDNAVKLTDAFLVEGIRPYCSNLQNLSLYLDQCFTDEGFHKLFEGWSSVNDGLINVNISRCTNIGDLGVQALINHCAKTIVILNLNSIPSLTTETIQLLATSDCEFLSQLDIGFLRCVGDDEIELISNACKSLQFIEAYGCIRITEFAKIRAGVKLVGRQSDSL
ncbi:hypothetical protein V1511DRAFT_24240 [Dipodascopsis uninucleata]